MRMPPTRRRSFFKKFKLKVTNWYFENGKNINQTVNNFQIGPKQVRNWLKDEQKIRSLKLPKKACWYGKAKFPAMKKEFYTKFLDMRKWGKHVKRWGFNSIARELVKEKYLDEASSFKLSPRWFEDFCRHCRVFLWRKTYVTQKPPALCTAIEIFQAKSLQERNRRNFWT